jgi:glycosyltransferase involved in cell wall biosynthesis
LGPSGLPSTVRILLTADPMIAVPPIGYGGIERIIDSLVVEFGRRGHDVGLVAHPASRSPAKTLYPWPDLRIGSPLGTLRNSMALRRAVGEFKPEVLHSFSRLLYLLPLLHARLPKIMSYQRHTGGRSLSVAARMGGKSISFTGCSEYICGLGRPMGGEWHAIPNFIDPAKFTFVPSVPGDAPLVFLSRIESTKGPDLAIAIARASGCRLILAGNRAESGPQRDYWDKHIAPQIGHGGVEWVGEVDDVRKNELLGRAAALLVPIQWDEPFGIVFAEALACGTPVLTCRRGALPEIIDPGRTGLFIQTLEEGVAATGRIGQLDRHACRKVAEEKFSIGVCAKMYLDAYAAAKSRACG